MRKNFVFDTNVLLTDPHAIFKFQDNNVVIPITVIEELDTFKRDLNQLGRNAREVVRLIDRYRSQGNLSTGVPLEHGGSLRVITDLGREPQLPFPTLSKTADGLILSTALILKEREDLPVVFVTRDINLRLRADAVGLKSVNYEEEGQVAVEELYPGHKTIQVAGDVVDRFLREGKLAGDGHALLPNQCVTLVDAKNSGHNAAGRFHRKEGAILPLDGASEDLWGIRARNREQAFAIDLLIDDAVQVVTLAGKAGTGKTLLAIAAGLRKTVDERVYSKMVVARPIMPLGREVGFLPGDVGEKLRPWMEPVYDNLEFIIQSHGHGFKAADEKSAPAARRRTKRAGASAAEEIRQMHDSGILEVQPLTYIRGRSLPRQYLVIDEAQNLTVHEVKTIVTRAGEGTKVVLTGDPYQIDNPFLDSSSNGLSVAAERFKGKDLAGHIVLTHGERSPLAEMASDLL